MAPAIEIQGLSKRYELGEGFHHYQTLREALASRFGRTSGGRDSTAREIWALREVDLAIDRGEVVGIIGRNGAGKTTLLKIVARITEPTAGVSRTRGRVGALLEVGTGFHPELTGRENIFLNGAVLGMSRREMVSRFDEIVAFAELERFLDTPVKRYSAGMYLRLAFAVAAHLESEIVVVDEVLAVGDAEFQEKCLGTMSRFTEQGRTVLFVSHDLGAITRLCSRAVWLDEGGIRATGEPQGIVDEYLQAGASTTLERQFTEARGDPVELQRVAVVDDQGRTLRAARRHEPFTLEIRFLVRERVPGLDIEISLSTGTGTWVLAEAWSDTGRGARGAGEPGEYTARLTIPAFLAPGDYVVALLIDSSLTDKTYIEHEVLRFRLLPAPSDRRNWLERKRLAQPEVRWHVTAAPESQVAADRAR